MFPLQWIRDEPEAFDAGLARRGIGPAAARILEIDAERRRSVTELQELRTERNAASSEIGAWKREGRDAAGLIERVGRIKKRIPGLEEDVRRAESRIRDELAGLPNHLAADVPDGADASANREVRRWGEPPAFGFEARDHAAIGEALGMMDFEATARMSGARFVTLSGPLARLERALANFLLDVQTGEHGYREVSPPALVREEAVFGTGQLPKFADDLFRTAQGAWLIPTAEVPLTNLAAGRAYGRDELPVRVAAWTPCFRAEAGAAGQDTRGMIRVHQFSKVELVSIVRPEDSDAELERMTDCAEEVLRRLGIPHRVVLLSAGDTGFAAHKTYDIEVWLPGQGAYREISSCSNCGDFQARRMDARYRPEGGGGLRHVHTLNGSGVAVGRLLIAVLENGQEEDGAVRLPPQLRPYLGGAGRIAIEPGG